MTKFTVIAAALVAMSATAGSAATIDTIDASNGGAGTYFVPTLGQEFDSPYRRGASQDWGWTHNAIASGFTSAVLNISAHDVDETPCGFSDCEIDNISAYDADSSTWLLLGSLTGDDNAFSFTEFDIYNFSGGILIDDIEAGLQLSMDIDSLNAGWLVSLGKSVISTDGAGPGNPNPNVVPLPAGGVLLLSGLAGMAALRRRRKS